MTCSLGLSCIRSLKKLSLHNNIQRASILRMCPLNPDCHACVGYFLSLAFPHVILLSTDQEPSRHCYLCPVDVVMAHVLTAAGGQIFVQYTCSFYNFINCVGSLIDNPVVNSPSSSQNSKRVFNNT